MGLRPKSMKSMKSISRKAAKAKKVHAPSHVLRVVLLAMPILLAMAVLTAGDALGCPNCKDAMSDGDPEGMNLARGYFYSILIMLAMPLTLVSSFGAYVWREMRRQKRAETSGINPPIH